MDSNNIKCEFLKYVPQDQWSLINPDILIGHIISLEHHVAFLESLIYGQFTEAKKEKEVS